MKNKILLTITVILLLTMCMPIVAYAKLVEGTTVCSHKYEWIVTKKATCTTDGTKVETCSLCGVTRNTETITKLGHSYDWIVTKEATCTETGTKELKCTRCGLVKINTDPIIMPKLEHEYGNWSTTIAATCTVDGKETRSCANCSDKQERTLPALGHNFSPWGTLDNVYHMRQCKRTGCGYIERAEHTKTARQKNDKVHILVCTICNNDNLGEENHDFNENPENTNEIHKCKKCQYFENHSYNVKNGDTIDLPLLWTCTDCNHEITLSRPDNLQGLPGEEYSPSDATIDMEGVPRIKSGTYLFKLEGGTLRNSEGEPVTGLKMKEEWVTLYGWTQRSILAHILEAPVDQVVFIEDLWKVASLYNISTNDPNWIENLLLAYEDALITEAVNGLAFKELGDWFLVFQTTIKIINNEKTIKPSVNFAADKGFYVTYSNINNGGWMFYQSPFFANLSKWGVELFGLAEKDPKEKLYANIFYTYRTTDGDIPKNGYEYTYNYGKVCVYDEGPIDVTAKINPDMDLINKTGYRYVGYKVRVGQIGGVGPSPYDGNVNPSTQASASVGFDYRKSAAYVTFFVEPVKFSFGQIWRDPLGKAKDVILKTDPYYSQDGLEFPDFYSGETGNCVIDVPSLYKIVWPAYILKKYELFGDNKMLEEKTYNDETTTLYGFDPNRWQVIESVESYHSSEEAGHASNKTFWFVYNTPQIDIVHTSYKEPANILKDINGKDVAGSTKILSQYAPLESLITDNVKSSYDIDLGNGLQKYAYPNLDLAQIWIYEKLDNGLEDHKVTLYKDPKYASAPKAFQVSDPGFEDYYVKTYMDIQTETGIPDLFNTNKNWIVKFRYDEGIPIVRIKYIDVKDGTTVLVKSGDTYYSEIIGKLDPNYTHVVGGATNQSIPIGYTVSNTGYNQVQASAIPANNGTPITVSGIDGSKYIIVFVTGESPSGDSGDGYDNVQLRSNKATNEEYDIEDAVPTSEDLYLSGDVAGYEFVSDISTETKNESFRIRVGQEYYTRITSGGTLPTATAYSDYFTVDVPYDIFKINKAELYDLTSMILKNNAIKYYSNYNINTGTYDSYKEDEITYGVTKPVPTLEYSYPEKLLTLLEDAELIKDSEGVYTIMLKDIASVTDRRTVENSLKERYNQNNTEGALVLLYKHATVYLQRLVIKQVGEPDVIIIDGGSYSLIERRNALAEGVHYFPFADERAARYKFYVPNGLFIKESAQNITYDTKFKENYNYIAGVTEDTGRTLPVLGTLLDVAELTLESINVHTPIRNDVRLNVPTSNTNVTQLDNRALAGGATIVNLEESFAISIADGTTTINKKGYNNSRTNILGLLNLDNDGSSQHMLKTKKSYGGLTNKIMTVAEYIAETEENSIGPAFAEYKLIRFPYDVYYRPSSGTPILFKAGTWYNLYEYATIGTTNYTFTIPVWVEDDRVYTGESGIQILIAAENCSSAALNAAKNNPMSIRNTLDNNANKDYILRTTLNTFVSGRVFNLQVRDSDDPGYMGKVPALKVTSLPLAQYGQVKEGGQVTYALGLKLGYRFYFDFLTKGESNVTSKIVPKIWYVPTTGGTATDAITLFYHSKSSLYNILSAQDLNINMNLSTTHGAVNNENRFQEEMLTAKTIDNNRVFTTNTAIGKILQGLLLRNNITRLPYNIIAKAAEAYGFGADTTAFINSTVNSDEIRGNQNLIKNSAGHWYGEFYVPASTIVVNKANATKNEAMTNQLKTGYLIVSFESIKTAKDGTGEGYLSYAKPDGNTMWQQESTKQTIKLPNNNTATVNTSGTCMAIYQVGLKANNDYEIEGTH